MCSQTGKFAFLMVVYVVGSAMGQDSLEEVNHEILCPPRSHDVFHKPCMDHCAKAYRNNPSGACGKAFGRTSFKTL